MQMPGRKYSQANSNYRYGFNGKENDNEVKGEGNQQDYGMRIYDPRVGKFLSEDPITKQYAELTPYQFASNRPIQGIDQDGLEFSPGQLAYDIFIKPFVNYQNAAEKYMQGSVQSAAAQTGNASYQADNSPVPDHVQKDLAKKDIQSGIGKQVSGATEMYIATADVVLTYTPIGTEAALAEKAVAKVSTAGRYVMKAAASESPKPLSFGNWGEEFIGNGVRTSDQLFNGVKGGGETWNLGESVVTKAHHNWSKIFGKQVVKLKDVESIVKTAVENGTWQKTDIVRGKGGKIIGDKFEMLQEVDGHKIWVGGFRETGSQNIIVNNAAVQ